MLSICLKHVMPTALSFYENGTGLPVLHGLRQRYGPRLTSLISYLETENSLHESKATPFSAKIGLSHIIVILLIL